jgi:uncharacterized protein YndB with AHSA1/START domain
MSTAGHEQNAAAIVLRRRFRAPRERVFAAWTKPEALKKWWFPAGWLPLAVELDVRDGGAYRLAMRQPVTGMHIAVSGRFLEVRAPERLRFSWRWSGAFDELPETLVTVDFVAFPGGTELILRHEPFIEAGDRHQHHTGWMIACGRLDRSLGPP